MKTLINKVSNPVMAQIDKYLPKGSFGRKVLIMLTGTVAGQLIAVLLSPVLTRIFSPEDFGALGSFSAFIMVLSIIAMLRYEVAIPMTKTKTEESNLVALCFIILSVMTALLTFFLMVVLSEETWQIFFVYPFSYRWLLPFGFFAVAAYQIMVYLATKQEDFKTLSKTKLYQGAAGPLTQIGLGLGGVGVLGLIVGFVVGQSTGITILFSKLVLKTKALKDDISIANMKAVAIRFKRFPLVSMWSALIGILSSRAALFLVLPVLYSPVVAGFVFLIDRVIARPLLLLTTSILQVYVGDVAKTLNGDPSVVKKRFVKLSIQQVVVVGAWLLIVNLAAPPLFPIVFGSEWGDAVPYLHTLSIIYFGQMVTMPLMQTLQVMEYHVRMLVWQVFKAIMIVGSFVLSYHWGYTALEGLMLYSVCGFTASAILYIIILHAVLTLKASPQTEDQNA